jgi:hypothetical protein
MKRKNASLLGNVLMALGLVVMVVGGLFNFKPVAAI